MFNRKKCDKYTEGVRKFQPRVCFETLGQDACLFSSNSEGVANAINANGFATPSGLRLNQRVDLSPGFQSKPWAGICERLRRKPPSAMKTLLQLLIASLIACGTVAAQNDMRYFITRSGDKLMEGKKEYRFISFNIPNLHLIEDNMAFEATNEWRFPDEFEITDALQTSQTNGWSSCPHICDFDLQEGLGRVQYRVMSRNQVSSMRMRFVRSTRFSRLLIASACA